MNGRLSIALIAAAISAFVLFGATQAQYPPPVGNVTVSAPTVSPAVGSTTTLTCELLDQAGAPIAGAPCTFSIVAEPGTDAAIGSKTVTKVTDENGIATADLYVGSTAGIVVISVTAADLASTLVLDVGGAAPPASPIAPPSTGTGGLR